MKKIIRSLFPVVLTLVTVFAMNFSAFAELIPTNKTWDVSFTPQKKMNSTFKTSEMDDVISGLQPGDSTEIVLNLKNDNDATVDWYMTNKVIKSLEDTRAQQKELSGGAYTYRLTFENPTDTASSKVLFSSETVGGETVTAAGEGLHEATSALGDSELSDWIYLDTFAKGEGGQVKLLVALDGETQGNSYQDTFAELKMNFAVELREDERNQNNTSNNTSNNTNNSNKRNDNSSTTRSSTSNVTNNIVRTGDETKIIPYIIAAGISGIVLMILAIYSLRERRRQRGGRE